MKVVVQHAVGDPAWRPSALQPAAVAAFAEAAERYGFSGIGFTDHPAPSKKWLDAGGEGSADPLVSLAFCAAATSRIRLMTFVLALPYRNPFLLAHQVATLDVLAGGRLDLGLGTGYLRSEMRALGADPLRRLEQFDDVVDVLRQAWTREVVSGTGMHWSAREVHVQPRPVQLPHPPLWLHGNGSFGRERAARYGDGWIAAVTDERLAATMRTIALPDPAAVAVAVHDLRRRIESAGRDPRSVGIGIANAWQMLDVRKGWCAGRMLDEAQQFAGFGADTMFVTICGDDPAATADTLAAFGEQVVTPMTPLAK